MGRSCTNKLAETTKNTNRSALVNNLRVKAALECAKQSALESGRAKLGKLAKPLVSPRFDVVVASSTKANSSAMGGCSPLGGSLERVVFAQKKVQIQTSGAGALTSAFLLGGKKNAVQRAVSAAPQMELSPKKTEYVAKQKQQQEQGQLQASGHIKAGGVLPAACRIATAVTSGAAGGGRAADASGKTKKGKGKLQGWAPGPGTSIASSPWSNSFNTTAASTAGVVKTGSTVVKSPKNNANKCNEATGVTGKNLKSPAKRGQPGTAEVPAAVTTSPSKRGAQSLVNSQTTTSTSTSGHHPEFGAASGIKHDGAALRKTGQVAVAKKAIVGTTTVNAAANILAATPREYPAIVKKTGVMGTATLGCTESKLFRVDNSLLRASNMSGVAFQKDPCESQKILTGSTTGGANPNEVATWNSIVRGRVEGDYVRVMEHAASARNGLYLPRSLFGTEVLKEVGQLHAAWSS
eukprot:g12256.t1